MASMLLLVGTVATLGAAFAFGFAIWESRHPPPKPMLPVIAPPSVQTTVVLLPRPTPPAPPEDLRCGPNEHAERLMSGAWGCCPNGAMCD